MKKTLALIFFFSAFYCKAQTNLKYSGFFDSYYTTGPLKYFVEPGITLMYGDLKNKNISAGIGAGINYRILPPIYLNGSLRYMNLTSTDHDNLRSLAHSSNALQLNLVGNYHFIYDLIRNNIDRKKVPKLINAYISAGFSMMLNHNITLNKTGQFVNTSAQEEKVNVTQVFSKFSRIVQFPVGLGMPIRVTPRVTITPEIMWYISFSDRIDGVEYFLTTNNDSYIFTNIKLMYNPKGKRRKPKTVIIKSSAPSNNNNLSDFDNNNDNFNDDSDFFAPNNKNTENEFKDVKNDIEETEYEENNDDFDLDFDENSDEPEDNKYDEDGFLIDEK